MIKTHIKKYIPALLAGLSLTLTACVDDALRDPGSSPSQEGDTPYYIRLSLKTSTGGFTRADETATYPGDGFQDGSHNEENEPDEHAIGPDGNFAIFFDADDAYIACSELYSVNEISGGHTEEVDEEDENKPDPPFSTEAEYYTRFYGFADRKPVKVLVVVNASDRVKNQVMDFPGWNIKEVMSQIWEESDVYEEHDHDNLSKEMHDPYQYLGFRRVSADQTYFAMTNSTYVETVTAEDGSSKKVVHCAESIGSNFTSMESEIATLKPVTVFLERMVSKFEFAVENTQENRYMPYNAQSLDVCEYNNGVFTYTDYKWAVEVLAWGMNGLERKNHLFKNVNPEENYFDNWNSKYYRRCWWSEDPHYEKKDSHYPWQHRDAKDIDNPKNVGFQDYFLSYQDNYNQDFALTYYPLKFFLPDVSSEGQLFKPNTENERWGDNYDYKGRSFKRFYTPENTFRPGLIVDRSQGTRADVLAGTHLLIATRLLYYDNKTNKYQRFTGRHAHLYRNRVGVSYLEEVSMFEDFMNAVNYKLESQKYIYYNYYAFDDRILPRDGAKGATFRATTSGKYALYYRNERTGQYRELTYQELQQIRDYPVPEEVKKLGLDPNKDDEVQQAIAQLTAKSEANPDFEYEHAYQLTIEAFTQNGDGKILPWISYRTSEKEEFQEMYMIILQKDNPDSPPGKFMPGGAVYDPNAGEVIQYTDEKGNSIQKVMDYLEPRRLGFEVSTSSGWEKVTRDNNDLKSLFFEIWGVADHFNHGLQYYAIPIHAIDGNGNWASTSNIWKEDEELEDQENQYTQDNPYYYGVVRNNWYKLTLRTINEIGVPISDPLQPIVPNYTLKKDQTKVEMEILQWHMEDIIVPID